MAPLWRIFLFWGPWLNWRLWCRKHMTGTSGSCRRWEKFPRSYRFSIGDNLVAASLDLLMNLVDASYQSRNTGPLAAAVRATDDAPGEGGQHRRYGVPVGRGVDGFKFREENQRAFDAGGRSARASGCWPGFQREVPRGRMLTTPGAAESVNAAGLHIIYRQAGPSASP